MNNHHLSEGGASFPRSPLAGRGPIHLRFLFPALLLFSTVALSDGHGGDIGPEASAHSTDSHATGPEKRDPARPAERKVHDDARDYGAEDAEIVAWRDRYLALGKDVYEWACAACHDNGDHGAPRIGDRDAWKDRSPLWSAVLLEHAKQGYLDMPARGGHPYLSDRAVTAAGEYLLGQTFPERPAD